MFNTEKISFSGRYMLLIFILFTLLARAGPDDNQKKFGYKSMDTIGIDLANGVLRARELPFDVPFYLFAKVPETVTTIQIYYSSIEKNTKPGCGSVCTGKSSSKTTPDSSTKKCDCNKSADCIPLCKWERNVFHDPENTMAYFEMPALRPNTSYRFYITLQRKADDTELAVVAGIIHKNMNKAFNTYIAGHSIRPGFNITELDEKTEYAPLITIINKELKAVNFDTINFQLTTASNGNQTDINKNRLKSLVSALNIPDDYIARHSAYDIFFKNEVILNKFNALRRNSLMVSVYNKRKELKLPKEFADQLDNFIYSKNDQDISRKINNGRLSLASKNTDIPDVSDSIGETTITPANIVILKENLQSSKDYLEALAHNIDIVKENKEFVKITGIKNPDQAYKEFMQTLEEAASACITQINKLNRLEKTIRTIEKHSERIKANLKGIYEPGIRFAAGGNSSSDYMTRSDWYITADIGLLNSRYGKVFDTKQTLLPYYGVNFNFSPINRNANYNLFSKNVSHCDFWRNMGRNLSGVVGLTAIKAANNDRSDLWEGKDFSLVTGLGLRITDATRISCGTLWTRQHNLNPLITKKDIKASLYISLSLDFDLFGKLQNLGTKLFP